MIAAKPSDPFYYQARQHVLYSNDPGISHLQRRLRIGYQRAIALCEALAGDAVEYRSDTDSLQIHPQAIHRYHKVISPVSSPIHGKVGSHRERMCISLHSTLYIHSVGIALVSKSSVSKGWLVGDLSGLLFSVEVLREKDNNRSRLGRTSLLLRCFHRPGP